MRVTSGFIGPQHNDVAIFKVELWIHLWNCYADFEVAYTFELVTQANHQKIVV